MCPAVLLTIKHRQKQIIENFLLDWKKKNVRYSKKTVRICFHTTVNFHYVRSITIFQIYRVPIVFFYAAAQKYKDYQVLDALLFVVSFQTTLKFAIFSQRETSGKNWQKTAAFKVTFLFTKSDRYTVIKKYTLSLSLSAKIIPRNNTSKHYWEWPHGNLNIEKKIKFCSFSISERVAQVSQQYSCKTTLYFTMVLL